MSLSARSPVHSLREQFEALPDNVVGELFDGELHVSPRPRPPHQHASSRLGTLVDNGFDLGLTGPGGWIILVEPGLELDPGEEIVPDLAGWKRERLPTLPTDGPITVVPDWACEVLSPSTAGLDHSRKMPYYARHGLPWLWFLDPLWRTLTVWKLVSGKWLQHAIFVEGGKVRAEPFDAIEIDLELLWPPSAEAPAGKPVRKKKAAKKKR